MGKSLWCYHRSLITIFNFLYSLYHHSISQSLNLYLLCNMVNLKASTSVYFQKLPLALSQGWGPNVKCCEEGTLSFIQLCSLPFLNYGPYCSSRAFTALLVPVLFISLCWCTINNTEWQPLILTSHSKFWVEFFQCLKCVINIIREQDLSRLNSHSRKGIKGMMHILTHTEFYSYLCLHLWAAE